MPCSEVLFGTYARKHEKLRRIDDAPAQNDFLSRKRRVIPTMLPEIHSPCPPVRDDEIGDICIDLDPQRTTVLDRMQIGGGRAPSPATMDGLLGKAETLLIDAVVVGGYPMPGRLHRRKYRVDHRILVFRLLHMQ